MNDQKELKNHLIFNDLKAYQRSEHSIWTDDYISQNMLTAHLDMSNDVASRNINTIGKTIERMKTRLERQKSCLA